MKICVILAVHLCFCNAATPRDTLGRKVSTQFKFFAKQKRESSEFEDVAELFGAESAIECSVKCLNRDVCMSFNVCQESFLGYNVRCELFKRRAAHSSLRSSQCSYYERESPCQNGGEYLDAEDRCKCVGSYAGLTCQRIMRDCSDGYRDRVGAWGHFLIQPKDSPEPFHVFCNNRAVGGTTYVMYRDMTTHPLPDFRQTWQKYKEGFGNKYYNFWIGNEHLYQITRQGVYELEVGVARLWDSFKFVYYEQFSVQNESDHYILHLGSYRAGTLDGDSLTPSLDPQRNINGKPFSTFDNDVSDNCSTSSKAGWWFAENCTAANLNGPLVLSGSPRFSWLYPFGNALLRGAYMQIRKKTYYMEMP